MKKHLRKIIACAVATAAITSTNTYGLLGGMTVANASAIVSTETNTDYVATIVSVNGKKADKLVGTTLDNNVSVKELCNLVGLDTNKIKSIKEAKITAADKENVSVSDKENLSLDTTLKFTGESKAEHVNGTQIRIRYTSDNKKNETFKLNISIKEIQSEDKEEVAETSEYSIEYRDYTTNEIISTTVYVPNEYVQTPDGEKVIPLKVGTVIKEENITGFLYEIPGYTRVETSLKDGKQIVIDKDSSKNVIVVYYRAN